MKTKLPVLAVSDPSEASLERQECIKCGLAATSTCKTPFMPSYVPDSWTGALLVIAEAPGAEEDRKGRPMAGKAGSLLYQMFETAGIKVADVALTNANRCWPGPGNATPSLTQVRLCRPFVAHDILRLRPKWVLCLGDNATKSVFGTAEGVKRHRQRAYNADQFFGPDAAGIKVAFSYHPASCFYAKGAEQKQRLADDLKWLVGFKGYVQGPENAMPLVNDHVGLDIEWGAGHELLTVGQAVNDKAVATEDKNEWTHWLSGMNLSGLEPVVVGHSIFGDLPVLRLNGAQLPQTWLSGQTARDTLLLARLANENLGAYDLESLGASISGIEPWKSKSDSLVGKGKSRQAFSTLPSDIRADRCRLDAWATETLGSALTPGLDPKLVGFTHELAALLKRVEMAGVKIDPARYASMGATILHHLDERRGVLKSLATRYGVADFEPSNDNHFRDLLFGKIGATAERLTAKDKLPAVDHASLVLLYQTGSDAIREAVLARLRHEKADKLYSTYIGRKDDDGEVGLAKHLTGNFYVFQHINPLGARTGRRSSDSPNMQNWPKRMRAMVVSRFPGGQIVKGDESQLEPRILAHLAGIGEWQELFESGGNLYLHTAKGLWKKDVEKDTPLYRMAKAVVLGTNYGMEEELFQEKLSVDHGIDLTLPEAADLLHAYHDLYPQLPRFFAIQKERLLCDQQITALTGQIRHLPCPDGERTRGFKHMWNQAVNFPVQALAAFVTGAAAMDLETAILSQVGVGLTEHYDNLVRFWAMEKLKVSIDNPDFRDIIEVKGKVIDYPVIVNEVHDELVVDTPGKDVSWTQELLDQTMSEVPTLRRLWPVTRALRLKAETTAGHSWAGE